MLSRLYHRNIIRYYQSWIEVEPTSPLASSGGLASSGTISGGGDDEWEMSKSIDTLDVGSSEQSFDWLQESVHSYQLNGGISGAHLLDMHFKQSPDPRTQLKVHRKLYAKGNLSDKKF